MGVTRKAHQPAMSGIAVVVPTYNRADLLPATLDRILAQSLPPAEIIVVDDGSTDGTAALLASDYPDVRPVRIANAGASVARFEGVRRARAELIAFCDSDDLWEPDHLETIDAARRRIPDSEVWFTDFADFEADPAVTTFRRFASMPPGWWRSWVEATDGHLHVMRTDCILGFLAANPVFPSALAARRERVLEAGWPDVVVSRLPPEDGDLTRRLVSAAKTVAVERTTVRIRKHGGNVSANKLAMYAGKAAVLTRTLAARPACFEPYVDAIRAARDDAMADALRHALWRKAWGAAADIYARGMHRFGVPIETKYRLAGVVTALGRRSGLVARDPDIAKIFDRIES